MTLKRYLGAYATNDKLDKIFIKEFFRFLMKHGIYDAFIQNFNMADDSWHRDLIKRKQSCHHLEFIDSAFSWTNAIEGGSFWSNMDIAWRKACVKINKKFKKQ